MTWWQWMLLGFSIIGAELLFPSFTVAWIGISALATACIVAIANIPLVVQVVLWVAMSVTFTLLWFKYLKPRGGKNGGSRSRGGRGGARIYELKRRR